MEHAESAGRVLVIIPTYKEAENITRIVPEVLRQDPRIDLAPHRDPRNETSARGRLDP